MTPGLPNKSQDNAQATKPMICRLNAILAAGLLSVAAASSASAAEPFNDAFFVRHAATAKDLFADRRQCSNDAYSLNSGAAAYSNPEYGALSAMGSALDEDALHEGGLHKRMQRAVLVDCMRRLGWTQLDPGPDEVKVVAKASPRHPEALDAWLKAHEPAGPPPVATAAIPSP